MALQKKVSMYKLPKINMSKVYKLPKKRPRFRVGLTPGQEKELEKALGDSYIITPEGIAALMGNSEALLSLSSRARKTKLVGFSPEENENE